MVTVGCAGVLEKVGGAAVVTTTVGVRVGASVAVVSWSSGMVGESGTGEMVAVGVGVTARQATSRIKMGRKSEIRRISRYYNHSSSDKIAQPSF
jgi:uncharacterized protein YdbL (DUF1318 family)